MRKSGVFSAIGILGLFVTMAACSNKESVEVGSEPSPSVSADTISVSDTSTGEELMCLCDTEEEAQKIAEMYGIELVSQYYGVATFHTDEDPKEVIKRGEELGYPELSLNNVVYLDDPIEKPSKGIQIQETGE